jgi:hypothetical protein
LLEKIPFYIQGKTGRQINIPGRNIQKLSQQASFVPISQRRIHFIYSRYYTGAFEWVQNGDEMNFDTASDCTLLHGFPSGR